ncbi:MAG: hypothetical protein BGP24_00825 [Lysobacterales bacterium 69-70]|nr:hypothetical protein [Xanthomonadaceae bacterium]ODU36153.1 MAG: hypothetical protein ABS97_02145 [Xanthomonadaceae bacterium SCN 69-320]ODV17581.1 MAG: hypothetical protein ABT27_16815 [Xanthomonadaceae bacterium SCN 69-25]OJY99388.1 MAG: hypothetical protein BGP24_00825 [Xanthomonadales bacterium 69-70]
MAATPGKTAFGAILALLSPLAQAQESCDYAALKGQEFQFAVRDESLRSYGYQLWSTKPEPAESLPYEDYVGKKGKFLGTFTGKAYSPPRFHNVILEDCRPLYFLALKDNIADEMLGLHGVDLLNKPLRNWSSRVKVDEMTDAKTCLVVPDGDMPYPMFHYEKGGRVSVGVVGGDFPGKDVSFRVDKLPALSEREMLTGAGAQKLVQQIRAGGKMLLVRSYEWPSEVAQTKEFNLDGIVAALDDCKAALR